MKKRRFLLIALMCCFVFAGSILVACNGEDSDFTVSFDTQGGSNIAEITVGNGQVIGEVAPPTKQCARFIGFALDAGGERMWNLQTDTVSADITLYAIWEDTHTWGEWTELFAPACETDGEKGRSCEVCGKTENEAIDALGHDYAEEYTEDVAPGCETTGSESRHCTRCGATTDSREIEALGHNYMVWAHDDTKHWQTCSRCGAVSEKTAHVYDTDGKCECGAIAATPASEFTFTDLGNNTWRVDGYSGSDNEIVIPSRYNGGKVISIGDEAFAYCRGLTSVTIPYSVTSIGDYAFYNCNGLTSITIGDSVTSIGGYAFEYCTGLTSVTIPDSVTSIGEGAFAYCSGLTSVTIGDSVTSMGDYAFSGCTGLTSIYYTGDITGWCGISGLGAVMASGRTLYIDGSKVEGAVTIPDGVTSIPSYAFAYQTGITSVTIGDGVTSIGDDAFYDCSGLTSVTIGDSVTSIGDYAFDCCYKLVEVYNKSLLSITAGSKFNGYIGYYAKNVYTAEGGSWFTDTSDGYRFLYDGTNAYLIGYYGDQTELTLPDSFIAHNGTEITEYGIYDYAFYSCDGLTSVTIPDSVTSIGDDAFRSCTGLTEINWNAVSVKDFDYNSNVFSHAGTAGDGIAVTFGDSVEKIPAYLFRVSISSYSPNIKSVIIGSDVKSIGYGAFEDCTGLTSITIPDGVTSIGNDAFFNCSGLTSVTIGDGVTSIGRSAFCRCTGLTSVTIGAGVKSIGYQAFSYCTGLTSIYYTGDITGWLNISGLANLASRISSECKLFLDGTIIGGDIIIPDGVESIPSYAFAYQTGITSVTIGDGVTSIGGDAFRNCSGLTSVTIGEGVTSIGSSAFSGCSGLKSITIPFVGAEAGKTSGDTYQYPFGYIFGTTSYTGGTGVTQYYYYNSTTWTSNSTYYIPSSLREVTVTGGNILYGAFYGCNGLTSVTIGDGVTSIGDDAFSGCTGLTAVTIGDGVTSIGSFAFRECSGLTSITVNENNLNYKSIDGNVYSKDGTVLVQYAIGKTANTFEIPDSVASIGYGAFYGCDDLTSITIPDSVTSIGDWAFYDCSGLTSVTIPDSVMSIGRYAFSGCTGLTSVTIGDGVTSIGDWAFRNCTGLTSVTIPDSVTSIGDYAFSGCRGLTSVTFEETSGWFVSIYSSATSGTNISAGILSDKSTAAEYLTDNYSYCYWKRRNA